MIALPIYKKGTVMSINTKELCVLIGMWSSRVKRLEKDISLFGYACRHADFTSIGRKLVVANYLYGDLLEQLTDGAVKEAIKAANKFLEKIKLHESVDKKELDKAFDEVAAIASDTFVNSFIPPKGATDNQQDNDSRADAKIKEEAARVIEGALNKRHCLFLVNREVFDAIMDLLYKNSQYSRKIKYWEIDTRNGTTESGQITFLNGRKICTNRIFESQGEQAVKEEKQPEFLTNPSKKELDKKDLECFYRDCEYFLNLPSEVNGIMVRVRARSIKIKAIEIIESTHLEIDLDIALRQIVKLMDNVLDNKWTHAVKSIFVDFMKKIAAHACDEKQPDADKDWQNGENYLGDHNGVFEDDVDYAGRLLQRIEDKTKEKFGK